MTQAEPLQVKLNEYTKAYVAGQRIRVTYKSWPEDYFMELTFKQVDKITELVLQARATKDGGSR